MPKSLPVGPLSLPLLVRDGSGYPVYTGNGFATGGPAPTSRSLITAWSPYPGLR